MTLSEISIRNPVFAWMLMAALILFGFISFSRMGVSEMPDVDFPVVTVHTTLEGAAPEVMESDVIDVVEDAVMSIQGIREVSSSARQGFANISVEFDLGRDIDVALQEVQTKIAQAQRNLPKEMDPPVVTKTNPEDQPIMWLSLSGEKPVPTLMAYTRDHLKDQLQTIAGVGDIFLGGYIDPNLRVWLKKEKLKSYELTVQDVLAAISAEHIELPAGRVETGDKELNVRAMGEALSAEEFGNIVIERRGGSPVYRPIYLKEVADVEEGLNDIRRLSRTGGKPSVGLGVRKQRGSNAVEVAHAVKEKLKELQKQLPEGLNLVVNFDSTQFIEHSIGELKFTLFLAALLTSLVCWLFLGSWSSTANILMAIPTSIVGTFIVLYFLGFTLNTFTLLGLVLAIGIVVDDAIMVLENIFRHQEKGQDKFTAALEGSKQITFAAIAATAAIVAIFLPVAFMTGVIGKFFLQFGITISVAVLFSLLEALTLTPMRCSQFVSVKERTSKIGKASDEFFKTGAVRYHHLLEICLAHRGKILLVSLSLFLLSFAFFKGLKKEFVPAQDQSMFLATLKTPVGSSIEFTSEKVKHVESFLSQRPEVLRYFAAVGGFGGGEVNSGMVFITLKQRKERSLSQQQFMGICREAFNKIPDLQAFLMDFSTRGLSAQRGFPIEFTIRGPSWDKLAELSQEIKNQMQNNEKFFSDVDTDYLAGMPEVRVIPDRAKAIEHGVSIKDISETINALIGGVRAGKFKQSGRRIDVRARLISQDRSKPTDIQSLYVRNNRGEMIQLGELVQIQEVPSLLTITRKNRERAIGVFANVAQGASQAKSLEMAQQIAQKVLPEGYRVVFGGSAQTFQESFESLFFALYLGIIISYMILASQFNSFSHPLSVLLALPFSVSGAAMALFISGNSLNIYSVIGLILLMGIVKKNSILLVDFTNQIRKNKKGSVHEALLEACPIRLRPILMTSIATIAAAVPAALALGPGSETRIPMAVAVIGGVFLSTLLTLFVVPCAYSLLARWEKKT
ncbi:MAG: acriflavin resistance protein [Deltaproteobacteria bacterium RIFCSPLOWO2_12_FULL_44_12]|nr:MAG: acriflavin resistance protein [Deltaproteobacteria bacterium RIFCSPHIGHO2_01_FULL_43_49]OGQ16503.1 MAG: acriflavin resistance protein [Deltaproteobacteria bacterium RIFCSPHIGHO2_02_FULL_44_53]OGQ27816.1 MAG: acriflavin resistance protein [Deltaproteobacteria bacterium RIFCSPHIGHO2_12_FULL_44_21]OGQ33020.1 MAG: acriflavin resistance protein [Deltaproteobacteria bacterium RIFCSPLOWO2_01_FULL_45_74]OGQ42121.1 MAG: acriflavin resistance protein [Deltaproteobacteria bacterium RIFCSPLOWO2_02_